jgi:anti-sigma factor RsiW
LWVSLAVDGELSEIEQVSLRAHVGRCAACAAFEHEVDALTVELRNASDEQPAFPIALPRRRSTAVRVLQISAVAAAIVLAAGLGSLAGSLSSGGTPTATTVARTAGGNLGARIDRGIVAMAPAQKLPASRIRPTVAI